MAEDLSASVVPADAIESALGAVEPASLSGTGGYQLPRVEFTAPRAEDGRRAVEAVFFEHSLRLALYFDGWFPHGNAAQLDARRHFLGNPLRNAILADFAGKDDLRQLRQRVISLRKELTQAEEDVAQRRASIQSDLDSLRDKRETMLAAAEVGLTLRLADVSEEIAAAESRLGRLDSALAEVRSLFDAAREKLKIEIGLSAEDHASGVALSFWQKRDSLLYALCTLQRPILTALAVMEATNVATSSTDYIIAEADVHGLLDILSKPDAPAAPAAGFSAPAEPAASVPQLEEHGQAVDEPAVQEQAAAVEQASDQLAPEPIVEAQPEPVADAAADEPQDEPAPAPARRPPERKRSEPNVGPMF